ncbi:MAG: hypothetical protein KTR27_00975 [Leptolyngbyaceae cyanobacterium MAG.088]|nr:hypothetical protein [Leptolyngbyaceae cyanobacterium MAG.088]
MYKLWIFTTEGLSCLAIEESFQETGACTFALAIQDQMLHIASVDCDALAKRGIAERRENSWQYDLTSGHLEMTRHVIEKSSSSLDRQIDPIVQYLLVQPADSLDAELYMFAGSSLGGTLSKFQDGAYEEQPQVFGLGDSTSSLVLGRIWKLYSRFFGVGIPSVKPNQPLPHGKFFVSKELDASSWTSISFPEFENGDAESISHLSGFNNYLYAGVSNRRQGFQLWKIDPKGLATNPWRLVIKRGACRYSHSCDVLEMIAWRGALYALVGVLNYRYGDCAQDTIPSPELIRLYADDSWDLILGTPRFSDTGLKVPLAAMGPGFDQPFGAQFQFMTVYADNLCIALRYQSKVQLWSTQDGESWSVAAPETFADLGEWETSAAISTPAGLAMISHPVRQPHLVAGSLEKSDSKALGAVNRRSQRKTNSKTTGATITNFLSSTENLLKHSHQNLFWFTNDSGLHGVLNLGEQEDFTGLVLCSSFDVGKQWTAIAPILGSDSNSTADSYLLEQDLWVVYSCPNGRIAFSQFQYNFQRQSWRLIQTSTIFESEIIQCSIPSLVIDSNSVIWCSFITQSTETAKYGLKLMYSNDDGHSWLDSEITLGAMNASPAKASRLVALNDRVGLVYTNQFIDPEQGVVRTRNWAHRMNNWSIQEPWKTQVLFQHTQAGELREDKAGSHFSAVSDDANNIYLVFQDQGRLMFSKFAHEEQSWQSPMPLTEDSKVTFVRVAVSPEQNKVFAVCNVRSFARVFEGSLDVDNFEPTRLLLHPSEEGLYFSSPRLLSPTIVKDKLPIFQQFKTDKGWGVATFELEV